MRPTTRWIPKDATPIEHRRGVVFKYMAGARPAAVAYAGKANKAAFHTSYRNDEQLAKNVEQFFSGLEAHEAAKAERAKARTAGHSLKVGDIIVNSWGYEQTNVDFYVVERTTKNYVWLRPIASEGVPGDFGVSPMAGYTRPAYDDNFQVIPIMTREVRDYDEYDEVTGHRPVTLKTVPVEAKMHRAEGFSVGMRHGSGYVWDGKPKYESWYA